MGIIATLILVILLTQSRLFDFLTETPLGRMVLLAFIILISYTNKILGLLAVLAIIIAFSQYTLWGNTVQSYNEGFKLRPPSVITSSTQATRAAAEAAEAARAAEEATRVAQEARAAAAAAEAANRQAAESQRQAEEILSLQRQLAEMKRQAESAAELQKKLAETSQSGPTKSVDPIKSLGGREGFCMTDRESNMLRGKQSNTIPVFNNSREQDDDISPSDKSVFTNLFSTF